MRKVFIALIALALAATTAFADGEADTGQRIYLKSLRDHTGMNGADFAALHTTAEWNALFGGDAEGFVNEIGEKYPNAKPYLSGEMFAKHKPYLKAFMTSYSKDSGNFPSCN
ncbi:MAG: hypothetical protein LBO72_00960 [Helicobacteraceae bacterium]|jgi:hypothetical protein|nr:hypothetical protein [Helicobacteraceae bacterium]